MKAKGRRGKVFKLFFKNEEDKVTGWSLLPTAILAIITGLVLGTVIALAWSAISVWLGW